VPGPTSITPGPYAVGRAQTFGDEKPGCAPNIRWTFRSHCDGGRAFGFVSTSVISCAFWT
jgi:hypothetical protein